MPRFPQKEPGTRLFKPKNRTVAQLAENRSPKPSVVGSIPSRPANIQTKHQHMISLLGRLRDFWNETITEVFVKASWPTAKELVDSTLVVITAVALLGAVVFFCDFSLSNFVQFATKRVR